MIVYFYRNADQLTEEQIAGLFPTLPQQQQDILGRIKNHRHRCEQVVSYIMLCHALGRNIKEICDDGITITEFSPSDLHAPLSIRPLWRFGEHGKPYIVDSEETFFNISHCNAAVAVGISRREIGIDVEGRRKFSESLLQRAFNGEEQTMITENDDPESEFARLWTRKEAFFKWTGTGILIDHLKSTEEEARMAECLIETRRVADFWLSIAIR